MSLEKVIPFTSKGGSKYLIQFTQFPNNVNFDIPIIDVSLVLVEQGQVKNTLNDLIGISSIIRDYLLENNVVLYYYCDNKHIARRNTFILPQAYRNKLFSSLYERINTDNFTRKDIIIDDNIHKDIHYISLISSIDNQNIIEEISQKIYEMNEK